MTGSLAVIAGVFANQMQVTGKAVIKAVLRNGKNRSYLDTHVSSY